MLTWRHRVRRRPASWSETDFYYDIVKYFQDEDPDDPDDTGNWTEDSIKPYGESSDDLRQALKCMLKALDEPPIEDDTPYEAEVEADGKSVAAPHVEEETNNESEWEFTFG